MLSVEWCSLCNSRPADGTLTIQDPISLEPLDVPACEPCVREIPSEDWINDQKDRP
jgi:hypothetical protein